MWMMWMMWMSWNPDMFIYFHIYIYIYIFSFLAFGIFECEVSNCTVSQGRQVRQGGFPDSLDSTVTWPGAGGCTPELQIGHEIDSCPCFEIFEEILQSRIPYSCAPVHTHIIYYTCTPCRVSTVIRFRGRGVKPLYNKPTILLAQHVSVHFLPSTQFAWFPCWPHFSRNLLAIKRASEYLQQDSFEDLGSGMPFTLLSDLSANWLVEGKKNTGKSRISWENLWFPVDFPLRQPIEW